MCVWVCTGSSWRNSSANHFYFECFISCGVVDERWLSHLRLTYISSPLPQFFALCLYFKHNCNACLIAEHYLHILCSVSTCDHTVQCGSASRRVAGLTIYKSRQPANQPASHKRLWRKKNGPHWLAQRFFLLLHFCLFSVWTAPKTLSWFSCESVCVCVIFTRAWSHHHSHIPYAADMHSYSIFAHRLGGCQRLWRTGAALYRLQALQTVHEGGDRPPTQCHVGKVLAAPCKE